MELYLINKNNETLDLLNNRSKFLLKACEGLHGVDTSISENESPYMDGANIEYVKALPRNIELTFKLRGNVKESLDYFTKYVKTKQYVTLREIENGRDISITGIATIPPYSRMQQSCEITLTIYCGQPYWEDTNNTIGVIDDIISLLAFPVNGQYFTINGQALGEISKQSLTKNLENTGDTSVGAVFVFEATDTVVNPRINCSTGEQQGWYMALNTTLNTGDQVVISTAKGNKYITINGSTTSNILSALEYNGTDWLQLEQGSNVFTITASSGAENIYFNATFKRKYE
jgi:hypothetical protein